MLGPCKRFCRKSSFWSSRTSRWRQFRSHWEVSLRSLWAVSWLWHAFPFNSLISSKTHSRSHWHWERDASNVLVFPSYSSTILCNILACLEFPWVRLHSSPPSLTRFQSLVSKTHHITGITLGFRKSLLICRKAIISSPKILTNPYLLVLFILDNFNNFEHTLPLLVEIDFQVLFFSLSIQDQNHFCK